MTQVEPEPTDLTGASEQGAAPTTGHPQVDAVISAMQGLTERPLEEHVAVFEQAHQTLRGALSEAASAPRGPQQG